MRSDCGKKNPSQWNTPSSTVFPRSTNTTCSCSIYFVAAEWVHSSSQFKLIIPTLLLSLSLQYFWRLVLILILVTYIWQVIFIISLLCVEKPEKAEITAMYWELGYRLWHQLQEIQRLVWLVWLSGMSTSLWTGRSWVQLPVRTHAWVAGQILGWGHVRGNQSKFIFHINVSLPLFLPSPLSKNK